MSKHSLRWLEDQQGRTDDSEYICDGCQRVLSPLDAEEYNAGIYCPKCIEERMGDALDESEDEANREADVAMRVRDARAG